MCSQNAGNAISETQILKMSWGHAQKPIEIINNTRLRYLYVIFTLTPIGAFQ